MKRASGVLLPVTSIPSSYGIGCFSKEAYQWIDQLREAGQSYWQILPLTPTGYGDSPYQSFSSFAGNPYFIDLEQLIEEGVLTKEECEAIDFGKDSSYVDYDKMTEYRLEILKIAFTRDNYREKEEYLSFVKENESWLHDYAMYMAIKYPNKVREILFMHIPDEREQRWIGTKFDKEAIQKSTGIDEVMDITVWEALVSRMMFKDNIQDVYVDIARWLMDYPANREQQIANHLKTVYPYLNIHNAYQTVCKMRTIKSKEEIEAHRKAVAITEEGVKFMMKNMKPGMTECQMEAYYDFILRATMLRHQHLQLLQQQVRTHV